MSKLTALPSQTDLEIFRHRIYEESFLRSRDTLFELVDALLLSPAVDSFAELSLSPVFRRRWSSLYTALDRGRVEQETLGQVFAQEIPQEGVQIFAIDKSAWHHPRARTLSDLFYERSPAPTIAKQAIVKAHPYSTLAWVPERQGSWAMPLSSQRISLVKDAVTTAIEQAQQLCRNCKILSQRGQIVIAGDGGYGNHRFLGGVKALPCAVVVRLRRDRVLYRPPSPTTDARPRKHGPRFAFKEASTWGPPHEERQFEDPHWGWVRLRRWNLIHAKQDAETVFSVLLCEVHLERHKPPEPLWLAMQNTAEAEMKTVWEWFQHRWTIEPANHFRKKNLKWGLPQLQQTRSCDLWTTLVDIAYWQLWLARDQVRDQPLPWQKTLSKLTPGRVKQSLGALFLSFTDITQPPKRRGTSPGWTTGRKRTPPRRHKTVKRGRKRKKPA